MWLSRRPAAVWTNPCGAISFSREVYKQYQAVYEQWQRQWYAAHPDVDADPRWYARPNPAEAAGYPHGFLKRGLDAAVLIAASSPDTDGFFWANDRVIVDVDSYDKLEQALRQIEQPVDMLILSGECLQVKEEVCGLCWREHNDVGFDSHMPPHIAALIHDKIKPSGLFLVGSCHAGNDPELVQQMADTIGRPVTAAVGVSRGVRAELLCHEGIYWTLGGYAEGQAYTLREPRTTAVS